MQLDAAVWDLNRDFPRLFGCGLPPLLDDQGREWWRVLVPLAIWRQPVPARAGVKR